MREAENVTVKEQLVKAIESLPDDATVEDAIEHLHLVYKIERGIAEADAGQKIPHAEARQRMAKWLE